MLIIYLTTWLKMVLSTSQNEDGQDLAEYALVLVFVAIVAVAGITALGSSVADAFTQITVGLSGYSSL